MEHIKDSAKRKRLEGGREAKPNVGGAAGCILPSPCSAECDGGGWMDTVTLYVSQNRKQPMERTKETPLSPKT